MRRRLTSASRLLALALALAVSILGVPAALAQSRLPMREVSVSWAGGVPRLSASLVDLADARVRRALESGLRKNIVVTVQAYREGSHVPIAHHQETCTVTYDLWEEAFVVRSGRSSSAYRTVDAVVAACLSISFRAIGTARSYERLRGQRIYFALRAEFNPISQSRCQRLLGNPGSDDPLGPLVVNIVRREICQAERALDVRSQAVVVP